MRRGAEDRRLRQLRDQALHFVLRLELRSRIHAGEMRERLAYGFAGLAVRHHGRELEAWVTGDQAQQLAGYVAGAAEYDCRDFRVRSVRHAAAPSTSRAVRPTASITLSPRAAPALIALNAATPSCF